MITFRQIEGLRGTIERLFCVNCKCKQYHVFVPSTQIYVVKDLDDIVRCRSCDRPLRVGHFELNLVEVKV